ncbi:MAG TPA: UDP-3-O-acyl-N-acetylglucosamine deacetylase [Planctomycetota bacterium]|nr:UDP-3-O-acyl-N-acetylglucosamine deacetylase [Planctomycetota bacterium]
MSLGTPQTTIARPVEINGVGLFSGRPVSVKLIPADPDTGVTFIRTDLPGSPEVPVHCESLGEYERRTTLQSGELIIQTVEHVLACCSGLGIDNLRVEISDVELPVGDGSALPFARRLWEAGLVNLDRPRRYFRVSEPLIEQNGQARLEVLPGVGADLTIAYELDYGGPPLGHQEVCFRIKPEVFLEEIAPARTFCPEAEALEMRRRGVGVGATYENTLIIGPDGPIGNEYRFPDEPARHKVLDLHGDLALLGRRLRGEIRAIRSGHALNAKLVQELNRLMSEQDQKRNLKLDIREIMEILPHRYPFLLVDRVLELDGYERAVGVKNVSINEHFFQGHFPGRPMMPGVLQIEAMAQLAGVLLRQKLKGKKKLAVLMGIDEVRFPRPVVPGDQLLLEAEAVRMRTRSGQVKCRASVDGKTAAEAVIKFMIVDYDENGNDDATGEED